MYKWSEDKPWNIVSHVSRMVFFSKTNNSFFCEETILIIVALFLSKMQSLDTLSGVNMSIFTDGVIFKMLNISLTISSWHANKWYFAPFTCFMCLLLYGPFMIHSKISAFMLYSFPQPYHKMVAATIATMQYTYLCNDQYIWYE